MYGCTKHSGLSSAGDCGQCGLGYCEDCLVFPFGPKKPPMCVSCALAFSGVRHKGHRARAPRQKLTWSERRRRKARPSVPTVPAVTEPAFGTDAFAPDAFAPDTARTPVPDTDTFQTDTFGSDTFETASFGSDTFETATFGTDTFETASYETDAGCGDSFGAGMFDLGTGPFSADSLSNDLTADQRSPMTSPSIDSVEGMEALIAVPLPKREVTADR